jgi:hypothetical protein
MRYTYVVTDLNEVIVYDGSIIVFKSSPYGERSGAFAWAEDYTSQANNGTIIPNLPDGMTND